MSGDSGHLAALLGAGVPLAIHDLQARGGPQQADLAWAASFGQELAEHGDELLYRGKRTAKLASDLIRAVAILAFCPGGVTLFGSHFEARVEEKEL